MEDMEEDSFDLLDDHNHNYCENGTHLYLRTKMSDAPQPQPVSPVPLMLRDHEKVCSSSTSNSKLMDLDSSSESSSEISDIDSHASSALAGALTLNSASKFRKFVASTDDGIASKPTSFPI